MVDRAHLVMPKLGLTMTEGLVADWTVTPGQSFEAHEVVAIIETDKIAYELPAPGAGRLVEILVPMGATVSVGTPIALWEPQGFQQDKETVGELQEHPAQDAIVSQIPGARPSAAVAIANHGRRIVATPLARRLAREAGIELSSITPSNPHRIRAADVKAAGARSAIASQPGTSAPRVTVPVQHAFSVPTFSIIETQVDADRLLRVLGNIRNAMPELDAALAHFVVLAAARTLTEQGVRPTIILQRDDAAPCLFSAEACQRLSTIVACNGAIADIADPAATLVVIETAGMTKIVRMPGPNCGASLGIGAIRRGMWSSDHGVPTPRAELNLSLSLGGNTALPSGNKLLAHVRWLLENPFVLLVM